VDLNLGFIITPDFVSIDVDDNTDKIQRIISFLVSASTGLSRFILKIPA
jgi:hypothetical protein